MKSKTYVITKKGKIYLRHNSVHEDIPIVIVTGWVMPADLIRPGHTGYAAFFAKPCDTDALAFELHHLVGEPRAVQGPPSPPT